MNFLITGDRGFISGYLIEKLLKEGHTVVGIDNDWKYGPLKKSFDENPNYFHYFGDAKNTDYLIELLDKHSIDVMIMNGAIIGGISLFHTEAYFLLAENERIMASSFDAAINAHKNGKLKFVVVMSSSMVYESARKFPSKEGDEYKCPPPLSTYGFQKLATQYFCKGAWEQYQLPYKIIRPFNAVGIGEQKAKVDTIIKSGNIELAMSHVVPDLVQKILKGQYPIHILGEGDQKRHYTYAGDLAEGIYKVIMDYHINEDFNLSTPIGHTVLKLAEIIWKKIGDERPFKYVCDKPFKYDVQMRIPDISKAKELLEFEATTNIETALDEIIPWVKEMIRLNRI